MENRHYDRQLRAMLNILENDYAGLALADKPVDSRYYVQAAGMAWKEGTLDGLTFLRFGSQMLATTGDRSLRLALHEEGYAPWRPGFDARRTGEHLVVTAVQEDARLRPGDRILRINALTPQQHRQQFQKNFLYADTPEREMWGNVLKMAKHMLVQHADGAQEDMPLMRFTGLRPQRGSTLRAEGHALVLTVGDLSDGEALGRLAAENEQAMNAADRLIIDLRGAHGGEEEDFLPLMPYILSAQKSMSEAAGAQALRTLYTEANCRRRMALLAPYAGDAAADALLADLRDKQGAGWVTETADLWADLPQAIAPRGGQTVLLTDSFTEGAAESFALLAKREGRARLVGRATRGALDYGDLITVALSEEIAFTYPMSITLAASEGRGFTNCGVAPDEEIPFTEEETRQDLLLLRAQGL